MTRSQVLALCRRLADEESAWLHASESGKVILGTPAGGLIMQVIALSIEKALVHQIRTLESNGDIKFDPEPPVGSD